MRARRSCLYVPADNARAIAKARTLPADVVILDLEDAVAPEMKAQARAAARDASTEGGFGARELVLRINPPGSPDGDADLDMAAAAAFDAVLLPKVEGSGALVAAMAAGKPLWAMIETPRALVALSEIAATAAPLACLVVGVNDLALALHCSVDSETITHARRSILMAARAFDLDVLDGVTNTIGDETGLHAACRASADLGFDGKTLIHPSQIEPANRAFTPTEAEIAAAHAIVAAFAVPENAGKGVIKVDGRMTERLHLVAAERTLRRAGL